MSLHFHPQIVQVINLGDGLLAGEPLSEEFLDQARQLAVVHDEQLARFRFFSEGQKKTPEIMELYEEVEEAFSERRVALNLLLNDELSEEKLERGLEKVLRTSQRLTKSSEDLEKADSQVRFSLFPILHDFVQAGLNVHGEHCPQEALEERLPVVISWIQDLEQDWDDELELFEVLKEREGTFQGLLQNLKDGVGAIFLYLEEGEGQDLLAGLHLLQDTSEPLAQFMAECQQAVQEESQFSPYRDIERLAQRDAKLGKDDPEIQTAIAAVERLLSGKEAQLNEFGEMPIDSEDFVAIFEDMESALAQEQAALEKMDLETLCGASLTYWSLQEEIAELLESTSHEMEEAPALQEYRKLLLGVYLGQTPDRFLAAMTETLFEAFEKSYQGTQEAETRQALELCLAALEQARLYLETQNKECLIEARRLLEAGAIASIAIEQEHQRQLAIEKERMKLTCPKCSHRNDPALSTCEECQSRLPFVADEKIETSSVTLVDSGDNRVPRNVRQLLDLAARVEVGQCSQEEVKAAVEPLLTRAGKLLEQASNSSDEPDTKNVFLEGVNRYKEGLELLLACAGEQNLTMLASAIAAIEEGSKTLSPFLQQSDSGPS